MVRVRYADHLRQRLAIRRLSPELVEAVYREATEHFRDAATGYLIAADRRLVAGRQRDVIVVYDEEPDGVVLITFHPPCGRARKRGGALEGGGSHDELQCLV